METMSPERVFKEYKKKLKHFISQKIGSEEDIEDILQETLISASYSFSLYSGKSSLFTWLCGIANHEIADYYRKKKIKTFLFSHFPFLENLASQALGPEEELLEKEVREEVKKVFTNLSEGYSQILRLKYYRGLSMSEIAAKFGMTVKAVESKLSRARKAFQMEWQKQR